MLKSRDASIPYAFYDEDILPPAKIERITNGKYGPMIPVEGGRLNAANPPIMPGMKPQLSRETYAGQDVIERDLERTLALGSNQTGATNPTRRTATEVATMQSSLDTRMAGEQQKVVDFFCVGVRKLDALVQRYSDQPKITQILGEDGQKLWVAWDKGMLAGRFLYTIKPDSQIHTDAAQDRQQDLNFYNLTARDPYINRMELARRLAQKWGFNPDKLVVEPPPQGPPPPNVQVRVQASDLDPRLPQFPFAVAILQQSGTRSSRPSWKTRSCSRGARLRWARCLTTSRHRKIPSRHPTPRTPVPLSAPTRSANGNRTPRAPFLAGERSLRQDSNHKETQHNGKQARHHHDHRSRRTPGSGAPWQATWKA